MNVVVVSPHLDDGVLSLGGTMHQLVRTGHRVTLVTVFAGNPENTSPAATWDRPRGLATAAEVVAARRFEDACAADQLGVSTRWLPFDDDGHLALRDPAAIADALDRELGDAERVFAPGWPLEHHDHRYVTMLLEGRRPLTLYCEVPYAFHPVNRLKSLRGRLPRVETNQHDSTWRTTRLNDADRAAKLRALSCYRGELHALGIATPPSLLQRRMLRTERTMDLTTNDLARPAFGTASREGK